MHIEHVELERFLGIRSLRLTLDPQFQIVAGPNNAGKTTLLSAFEFFFSPHSHAREEVQPRNTYYLDEGPRALTRVRLYLNGFGQDVPEPFASAQRKKRGDVWVEVRMSRSGEIQFRASNAADGAELHSATCDSFHVVHVPAVRVQRSTADDPGHQRLTATVNDVLVKSRPGPQTSVQKTFARQVDELLAVVQRVLNSSKEELAELVAPGVELDFRMPAASRVLAVILSAVDLQTRAGTDLYLRDEGTGLQSLLSLGVLSHAGGQAAPKGAKSLFLVEEPEAFLHPQFQRIVAQRLRELSNRAQLIVTTHSPLLVDSVDVRRVCRLPRDPEGVRLDWRPSEIDDAQAGRLATYCDARNSELVFADYLVLCEGPSDEGVVRTLVESYLGNPSELGLSIIAAQSKDKVRYFVDLAVRFGTPFFVVFDKDAYSGSSREALRATCRAAGRPLTSSDTQRLANVGDVPCNSQKQAQYIRDSTNAVLSGANVFTLSGDMECAVAHSYRKSALLEGLGPAGQSHLSYDACEELRGLQGPSYVERLRRLLGSKGWNTESVGKDNKPKPHVIPMFMQTTTAGLRKDSDLSVLLVELRRFLEIG